MCNDSAGSLLMATRALIRSSDKSILDIHKATDLPFYWLAKFKSGQFENPSVNRTQILYEYLTGSKLIDVK